MSRRRIAPLLLLALAVGGCGGSSDDGSGYVRDWTTACRNLQVTERQLRVAVARVGVGARPTTPSRSARRIRPAFERYATATSATLRGLRAIEAPDRWADYDRAADRALTTLDDQLQQARRSLAAGDLAALRTLATAVRTARVPAAPADLAGRLTACRGVL